MAGGLTVCCRLLLLACCLRTSLGQACYTLEEDRGDEARATLGAPCVFPFIYKGVNFTACTDRSDPDGFYWCSTKVNSDGEHLQGNFGYCEEGCPGQGTDDSEEDTEVNEEEELDLDVRSSSLHGRTCLSSKDYAGTCRKQAYCKGSSYSYSRTCGWSFVCCKRAPSTRSEASPRPYTPPQPTTVRRPTPKPKPLPQAGLCGLGNVEEFVFGGQEAKPGQFPFMVSFVYVLSRGRTVNFCGGVLVTSRHVLTASHCFSTKTPEQWLDDTNIDVRIGLNNLQSKEKDGSSANIAKVVLHPQYTEYTPAQGGGVVNDVAIVTLDRDVDVAPVCLPGQRSSSNPTAVVVGFGKIVQSKFSGQQQARLRFAYLEEMSNTECQRRYDAAFMKAPQITREMLCAGNTEADACSGDSGGPFLYLNTDYAWMVSGVVSFGPSSCGGRAPGVYANVEVFKDWINEQIRV